MRSRVVPLFILVIYLLLIVGSKSGSAFGKESVDGLTRPYLFSFAGWEINNLAQLTVKFVTGDFENIRDANAAIPAISEFLDLTARKNLLELEYVQKDFGQVSAVRSVASDLDEVNRSLSQFRDRAQQSIGSLISEELWSRGFGLNPDVGFIFPPLYFKFGQMPYILVLSPRNNIELNRTVVLRESLTFKEIENIENGAENAVTSSLVDKIGGIATYPSIVSPDSSLQHILSTVAHEWLHQYLIFFPLGGRYASIPEMTMINETVADIFGEEIGRAVYEKYYGPGQGGQNNGSSGQVNNFNFGKEMRLTRVTVDAYLKDGMIDEAESYMKERQKFFADNGYFIRRLNQAYFAWHGTYADGPIAVSPIGAELKSLRSRSESLLEFIKSVRSVRSLEDYRELIAGRQ